MSQLLKKLQERIPFSKAADIEKSMVAKHGAAETYGPGTFGVEFETEVSDDASDTKRNMIMHADLYEIANFIARRGLNKEFDRDYEKWLMHERSSINRSDRHWNDFRGPIDIDTWLSKNPQPDRKAFDVISDYDDALEDWNARKKVVDDAYRYWEQTDKNKYRDEFVYDLLRSSGDGVYRYIELNRLFSLLFPNRNSVRENKLITSVREWLESTGERVSNDEQGHKDAWGVGTDGANVEIRTKHMQNEDVKTLVALMDWMKQNRFQVTGGTSAHVHVGLPEDFDYFDLLVMMTLVDEDRAKTDAGPDRELDNWAKLRDRFVPYFLTNARGWMREGGISVTLSEREMGNFIRYSFNKFQGTNITAFFQHGTVEFRYFSSKMIANPALFVQWIKYFMLLPAVAKKRSRVTFVHPTDPSMKLTAVRQRDRSVMLSMGKRVADAGEKPSDLKGSLPPEPQPVDYDMLTTKEQSVKHHLDRLEKKQRANDITDREQILLRQLRGMWEKILNQRPIKI